MYQAKKTLYIFFFSRKRCDHNGDCSDESDEDGCDYLEVDEHYIKEVPPPTKANAKSDGSSPLPISVAMTIHSFASVDTVNLKFTADFTLILSWNDRRLSFSNLNLASEMNVIGEDVFGNIWTPQMAFSNVLGSYQVVADDQAEVILMRNRSSSPKISGLDSEIEGMWYKSCLDLVTEKGTQSDTNCPLLHADLKYIGEDNPIQFSRQYYMDFTCDFDLLYYPFDTQVCAIAIKIQNQNDHYLDFVKGPAGISYNGNYDYTHAREITAGAK